MKPNFQHHEDDVSWKSAEASPALMSPGTVSEIKVSLLTGGSDRPYVFGLVTSLIAQGVGLDLIGSDELDFPEFRSRSEINFLNLRGSLQSNVNFLRKI